MSRRAEVLHKLNALERSLDLLDNVLRLKTNIGITGCCNYDRFGLGLSFPTPEVYTPIIMNSIVARVGNADTIDQRLNNEITTLIRDNSRHIRFDMLRNLILNNAQYSIEMKLDLWTIVYFLEHEQ